ncbi:MAG: DUF4178 domain-containing protein [Terracidiphilus sp.]
MSTSRPGPAGTPRVEALNCPNCGASLTLRSPGNAVSVVCESCHSVLDARDPRLKVLQTFSATLRDDPPLVPLGSRGAIRGTEYEVIGFQRRTIEVEGIHYSWHEYVLFNPVKGFRYLTEYDGHWNDVSTLRSLPDVSPGGATLTYLGESYKIFQTADAATTFVLGEFPWQVRVGETVSVSDYVSPPRVISSEGAGNEVTWSIGEYLSGRDLWKAFKMEGEPPAPVGVYENQPSPMSANVTVVWVIASVFLMMLVPLLVLFYATARSAQVLEQTYQFDTSSKEEASFVTEIFELKGHTSDVELTTSAAVDNNWIYLNYALINEDTGQAYDFGREVSYYHGVDSDGSWTEGSTTNRVTVPSVPPGNYYLRIEPESDPNHGIIYYTVTVKRDVPQASFFGLAALALLIPTCLITWRSLNFEHLRWAESGYGSPPGDSVLGAVEGIVGSTKRSSSGDNE